MRKMTCKHGKARRDCKNCHADYMRVWRKKQKDRLDKMKSIIKEAGLIHKVIIN